ncbi:MAG: hypothetical protein R3E13_07870 [Alphaproteobacteria bacterium]
MFWMDHDRLKQRFARIVKERSSETDRPVGTQELQEAVVSGVQSEKFDFFFTAHKAITKHIKDYQERKNGPPLSAPEFNTVSGFFISAFQHAEDLERLIDGSLVSIKSIKRHSAAYASGNDEIDMMETDCNRMEAIVQTFENLQTVSNASVMEAVKTYHRDDLESEAYKTDCRRFQGILDILDFDKKASEARHTQANNRRPSHNNGRRLASEFRHLMNEVVKQIRTDYEQSVSSGYGRGVSAILKNVSEAVRNNKLTLKDANEQTFLYYLENECIPYEQRSSEQGRAQALQLLVKLYDQAKENVQAHRQKNQDINQAWEKRNALE